MDNVIVIWILWILFVSVGLVFSVFRQDTQIGSFLLGTASGIGVTMLIIYDSKRIKKHE